MLKVLLTILAVSPAAFASTIVPFERDVARVERYSFLTSNNEASTFFTNVFGGDEKDELYFYAFDIENAGPNIIVPTTPETLEYAHRTFSFVTDDNSRRDTYLWITDDIGSGRISDLMESAVVFLPRVGQMHVEEQADNLLVTLTTGEEVSFKKSSNEIVAGVLKELPIDFNSDRTQRNFARLAYSGQGTMIRSNARGADPRLAKEVSVLRGELKPCKVPGPVFWTQEGFPKFKFVRDEEAYEVIRQYCGEKYLPGI